MCKNNIDCEGRYSALAVANYLINTFANNKLAPLTPMKLQKLIYIAHGVYLAYFKKPLIKEEIESWPHGPVIVEVYKKFKEYSKSPIPKDALIKNEEGNVLGIDPNDEDTNALLEAVCTKYENVTATDLSRLTHQPNTPWSDVYGTGKIAIIDNNIIRRYYEYKFGVD